jgi:hypothetical protein
MADKIIMQDPKIYSQLGELTGRFNTFEKNIDKQFKELKEMVQAQNNVPYSVFEKNNRSIKSELTDLSSRVDAIEDKMALKEATITGKLASFLDNSIVKLLGASIVSGALMIVYINSQHQINDISKRVDKVFKTEQTIEKESRK